MINFKIIILMIIGITCSFPIFANNTKPIACKDFHAFSEIRQQINSLDQAFQWDNPSCKIVGIKSIFPRKNKNGVMQFEKGLQLFVYQDYQLKFICLPGWVCKAW